MKQQQDQSPKTRSSEELNHHDVAQGVTTNPQDVGGGGAPIGGHHQESRTWTQGGPSHGNPATLRERESKSPQTRASTTPEAESEAGEKQGSEHQDPAALPVGKKHEKRETM